MGGEGKREEKVSAEWKGEVRREGGERIGEEQEREGGRIGEGKVEEGGEQSPSCFCHNLI